MDYYLLTDDAKDKPQETSIKLSDIIEGGKEISGDWLKKEVHKRIVIQEQIEKEKKK